MDKLTPSAQRTLDALSTGPGNVHELSERTGRSRSTTDKALNDLARAGLIVKVADGGDPADGAPTRWQLAAAPSAADEASHPANADEASQPTVAEQVSRADTDAQPGHTATPAGQAMTESGTTPDLGTTTDPGTTPDPGTTTGTTARDTAGDEAKQDGGDRQAEAEPPKLCRGCQAQMPKVCQDCWQKTPAYCGRCRRTMPQVRRGEPGEPIILSNGLPKLRPGELEALVEKVMREQPLPAFGGVVGWTGGRLAIHLPGRSPGAITNAMRKFTTAGKAELIGDTPERYKLKNTEQAGQSDPDPSGEPSSDGPHPEGPTDPA